MTMKTTTEQPSPQPSTRERGRATQEGIASLRLESDEHETREDKARSSSDSSNAVSPSSSSSPPRSSSNNPAVESLRQNMGRSVSQPLMPVPETSRLEVDEDELLTLEEVFENPDLMKSFERFLETIFCAENLRFYLGIRKFERTCEWTTSGYEKRGIQFQERLYFQFVSEDSPQRVNLSAEVQSKLNRRLERGAYNPRMFNSAKKEIYDLMETDSLPKFVKSADYRKVREKLRRRAEGGRLAFLFRRKKPEPTTPRSVSSEPGDEHAHHEHAESSAGGENAGEADEDDLEDEDDLSDDEEQDSA